MYTKFSVGIETEAWENTVHELSFDMSHFNEDIYITELSHN